MDITHLNATHEILRSKTCTYSMDLFVVRDVTIPEHLRKLFKQHQLQVTMTFINGSLSQIN